MTNNKYFTCKMLNTTNKNFEYLIGVERKANIGTTFMLGTFSTSYIVSAKQTGNIINVKTRNSEYNFEVLDGHVIDDVELSSELIELIEDNIRGREMLNHISKGL